MLAGEVVAVEKHPGRARELEENARRLGAANVTVVNADGLALPTELTGFDRALVDAPCSGLGILASRPDARWRAEPLPELQLALLRAAAERVKPGGTVTYSVCTINAAENEAVVDASGPRARAARRRVAGLPPPASSRAPADAPARPPDVGILHRPPQGAVKPVRQATPASSSWPSRDGWKKSRDDTSPRSNLVRNAAPPS